MRGQERAGESWLAIGVLKRPHGVHGWARFLPYSGEIEILQKVPRFYLLPPHGEKPEPFALKGVRPFKGGALVLLDPPLSREELFSYRNAQVLLRRSDLPPLEEGEVYLQDLFGLKCILPNGDFAGEVKDGFLTGKTACLVVEGPLSGYLLYHHEWVGDPDWERGILPIKRRPLPFHF
jgi:16S rRNA processing protein RimM